MHKSQAIQDYCEPLATKVEMRTASLNDLVSLDHPVRQVEALDLSKALTTIESIEGRAGRSAIDPKILVALLCFIMMEKLICFWLQNFSYVLKKGSTYLLIFFSGNPPMANAMVY